MVSKTASFKEFYFSFVSGVGEKLARELEKISREKQLHRVIIRISRFLFLFFFLCDGQF